MHFVFRVRLFAVLGAICSVFGVASSAHASHFRSGNLSWTVPDPVGAPRTVRFTVTAARRASMPDSTALDFGDGTTNPANFGSSIGTGVDALGNAYVVTQYAVSHTYATAGTFTAFFEDCCRVAGLENGASAGYRVESIVSLASGNTAGPVSAAPAVIQLQVGGVRSYVFPMADADSDPTTCRFGTAAETGLTAADAIPRVTPGGAVPSLAVVGAGCELSWDLTRAVVGQQYVVHVVVESTHGGVISNTATDFIVEMVLPAPPTCAGSGFFVADVGATFVHSVIGSASTATALLTAVGVSGVLAPVSGTTAATPFTSTLTWVPALADAGTTRVVQISYTSNVPSGAGSVSLTGTCFVTIQVPLCSAFGAPCSAGVGACMRAGTNVCAGRGVTICNAMAGAPALELCDALDNDCDGAADESDANCLAPRPRCGGVSGCVECLAATDCNDGIECTADTCTASACAHLAAAIGSTCATGVCDGTATPTACVECVTNAQCRGDERCFTATNTCKLPDTDGDGLSDETDLDDDNDGVPDLAELGADLSNDDDDDGIPDWADAASGCADADVNGRCDELPVAVDFDRDGTPNHLDRDADGDGLTDLFEAGGADDDHDGTVDGFVDVNSDGLHDPYLATPLTLPDSNTDGAADYLALDADGDGVIDAIEGNDANADGVADTAAVGRDTDADGLDDTFDLDCVAAVCAGVVGLAVPAQDTDLDLTRDYRDTDDDEDGVDTRDEDRNTNGRWADDDLDADAVPDYLDARDDRAMDAGTPDLGLSDAGPNDLGSADAGTSDAGRVDGGIAPSDAGAFDADVPRVPGGFIGGAGCDCAAAGATEGAAPRGLWWIGLTGLLLLGRRRRLVVASALVLLLCASAASASAQSGGFTLNQFRAAETGRDGFAVSHPDDFGHLNVGARLVVDYAHEPLVYESTLGDASTQSRAVVSDTLTANVALSLSLFRRLVLFAGLPVTLWSDGPGGAGWPNADGTALGDGYLGARVRLLGEADDVFALALQVTGSAPVARAADGNQTFTGERTFALLPRVVAAFRPGDRVRIDLNLGGRFRGETQLFNLTIGQELTYGLGLTITLLRKLLDVSVEGYGATSFDAFFGRATTPVETLVGARLFPVCGLSFGLAGGLGLARGYGAPNFRGVFEVSYTARAQCEPTGVVAPVSDDRDDDGVPGADDRCPTEAEDLDFFEDGDGCPDPDNDADGIADTADSAPLSREDVDSFEDTDGAPDPDNDRDGVLDASDRCGDAAEDLDGMQDDDGCPETDVDEDTVPDELDRCPLTRGVANTQDPSCSGCPAECGHAEPPATAPAPRRAPRAPR